MDILATSSHLHSAPPKWQLCPHPFPRTGIPALRTLPFTYHSQANATRRLIYLHVDVLRV